MNDLGRIKKPKRWGASIWTVLDKAHFRQPLELPAKATRSIEVKAVPTNPKEFDQNGVWRALVMDLCVVDADYASIPVGVGTWVVLLR